MAQKIIIDGRIFEDDESGLRVIVNGRIVDGGPAGGGVPTLSSPGVINVQSDRATPQVTLTF